MRHANECACICRASHSHSSRGLLKSNHSQTHKLVLCNNYTHANSNACTIHDMQDVK
jgi:hypothetical protein